MNDESLYCYRCRDVLRPGDDYFDLDGLILCPDCAEAWFGKRIRTVGDVVDKTN